ncbi:probable tyrosine-protein kinase BAZ1B at N-terminal half [Coccomyxa sp. Obi]|nr:probable tyrosine-protein kinase BAZ1B at N-terminal half [Coccomyxa sp. Obi]
MPLWKGQPYATSKPALLNLSSDSVEVLLIRFTGEIFTEFEEYSKKLSQYRKRAWSCQETGKAGLTYEEALLSEARAKGAIQEVPECYEEPLLRFVHHATGNLEDVAAQAVAELQNRIIVGEEVTARVGEAERPCAVLSITSVDHISDYGEAAGEPEQILEVAWLDGVPVSEGAARIHLDQISRRQFPLNEALVTTWIQENAHAQSVPGVKGFPCIWHVNREHQEQYGLPSDLPKDLVRQIKAAQKAAEEKPKPPKKQAEPRKPRKAAQEVDPEVALSIKAEAAAIAAAAFADAAAAAPQPSEPGPDAPLDGSRPGAKRPPGSGTKRKPAVPKAPREPKPPKQPREPKQPRPKKASVPELDPEAALSIKAEAAAIAAAVFAEAANKSQPAEPISAEEPPPKKRRRSSGAKAAPKRAEPPKEFPGEMASPASGGDNSAAVAMDVASLSAEELEKIPGLKCESIEETEQRIPSGTVKHAIFEALKAAGEEGLDTGALVEAVTAAGVKSWEDMRIAKSSVASSCTHDPAFARLQKGRFALRALRPDLEEATVNAILQRAANRQGGLAAAAAARNAAADASTPQNNDYHKNSFKCSKCHRTHHLQGSPMLLCDSCPRGFHMACLELDYDQLSTGEWACPKCAAGEAKAAKREARAANKDKAFLSEKEKEERKLQRALAKAERQLAKHQQREEKELLKLAEREARSIVKAASPRNASKMPSEDLQVLEEEKENLRKLEERVKNLAEEAAHAAEMEASLADAADGVAAAEGAAAAAAALRERQRDAEEKLARLRKAIEGPPQLEVVVSSPSALASLMDALAISEFLAAFGVLCEAAVLRLPDIQKAAARPLSSPTLSKLYMSLLRCVLLEKVGQDGLMRSRARRWARVVDEATWPEVLRRYLLATRATLPQPSADDLSADPASLDDDVIAVCAAELLAERPYHRLAAPLHLRLLLTLCNDVANGSALRAEFAARIDEAAQMQTQHRQLLIEEKKERQRQDAAEAEAKAAQEAQAAAPDQAQEGTPPAADAATSVSAHEEAAKMEDAKSGEGKSETAAGPSAEKREREDEEVRQRREAEFDEQIRARAVRADLLGQDRHCRRYWWLQGEQGALWVEEADGGGLSLLSEPAQLEALIEGLNRRGIRERGLLNNLKRRQQQLTDMLGAQTPEFVADLADINRAEGARLEKMEARATAAALSTASAQAKLLVDEVAAQKGTLADTLAQWHERLRGVASVESLISALRDLETQLNVLGDGLPKGAKDEQLQPLLQLQNGHHPSTPTLPETLPNGHHTGQEDAHSNGGSVDPSGEGESLEEAARSSQDGQPVGSSRGPSQELQFEGEEDEAGAPARPRPRRPKYVTPVDELDESDAEAAQRDSRRIGLWRSARERAVWLLDVQRAEAAGSVAAAAYATVVLRDRMQPLLHRMAKRLARAARMAERSEAEAAAADADEALTESDADSDDDRPLMPKAAAPAPPPAPAAADKAPTKLKLKLKVGGVAIRGGEGKKKKESKKGSRQPSAEVQPEPSAEAVGIRDWPDDDDDDRWGSECFKCGQDGDLLCCEGKGCRVVMHPSCAGLAAVPEGDWLCPEHAAAAEKRRAAKAEKAAAREKVPKKAKVAPPGGEGAAAAKTKTSSKKRDRADNESGGQKKAGKSGSGLKVTFKRSKAAD